MKLKILLLICIVPIWCLNAKPIKVMLLTGKTDRAHNWEVTSCYLKSTLDQHAIFATDVVLVPTVEDSMKYFEPDFSKYKVVVLAQNGFEWSEKTKIAFVEFVKKGGGVVVIHETNNSYPNWKEYNQITGLGGWGGRNEKSGPYYYWKNGAYITDNSPGAGGKHGKRVPILNWHYGVYFSGVRALYEVTGDNRYKDELMNIGQSNNWQQMDEIYNADRLTVVDTWAWLYIMEKDPKMIDKSKWALDIHLARGYHKNTIVSFKDNPLFHEWWSWCDALFMAPPAFVEMWKVTGETKYLDYMSEQWWKTSDYLYSKEDSLYYRDDRYFDKRSDNGKKIFWGRGNGWVIAGLAKVLTLLP